MNLPIGELGNNNHREAMKKIFYLISLAAMVIAGCAKEAPETQEQTITPNNKVVALYATMPEFIDAQTKAEVKDSGVFTWNESDPIKVIYTNGTNEKEIIFLCADASEGRFEPVDPADIEVGYTLKTEGTVAYYPTGYEGTPSNCDYAMEIDEAKANFQMHATNDNGTLKFVHDNALLKVTVSNVPAFAKTLTVGGVSVNLNLTEADDVTAYIPVAPAASAKMSISVTDDANNTIISKNSQNSVAIEAANLYNLPNLTIDGTVFIFDDSSNAIDEARFFKSDGNDTDYSVYSYLPLSTLSNGKTKWCILNKSELGSIVELQTFKNSTYKSETKSLFLYRNFDIIIPEGGSGIKTNYRTYFYLNSQNSQQYWGNTTNIVVNGTSYPMTKTGDYLFYYENSIDDYGRSMSYKFNNGNNWNASGDSWNYTLNREYQYNFNG